LPIAAKSQTEPGKIAKSYLKVKVGNCILNSQLLIQWTSKKALSKDVLPHGPIAELKEEYNHGILDLAQNE
jgi:hypothetical protein